MAVTVATAVAAAAAAAKPAGVPPGIPPLDPDEVHGEDAGPLMCQVSPGAPLASVLSPSHRVHAGDPNIRFSPTPGGPDHVEEEAPRANTEAVAAEPASPTGAQVEMLPHCDACGEQLQLVAGRLAQDAAYYMNNCAHVLSRRCLRKHIQAAVSLPEATQSSVFCPIPECRTAVASCDLLNFISREQNEKLLSAEMRLFLAADETVSYVQCPGCKAVIERDTTDVRVPDQPGYEIDGRMVSKEQYEHHLSWRFRCRACSTVFCASCGAVPYHRGLLCHQTDSALPVCRFCDERPAPGDTVCSSTECRQRDQKACQRVLQCGHLCHGVRGESNCPPCLKPGCTQATRSGRDWCSICYSEELRAAPVVTLCCNHTFHHECLRQRLLKKWPGPRISFGFLNCPECGHGIRHPAFSDLLSEMWRFRNEVRIKAMQRLRHEKLDRDPAVSDPKGAHYNDPAGYALEVLSYYQCYVCEKAYFGGVKRCEPHQEERARYNPSELVCANCLPFKSLQRCKLHGSEFVEYKCKFCCSVAQWFCWGSTHFCAQCHRLQERGEFVTKRKPSELPQCKGKAHCPLGIDHPPNGSGEFSLGCAICRDLRQTQNA
eukprot:Hpha_TRINITY_DN16928_c2_g10::TRINITY_DN16928_c2_g10_i1::g.55423::m.55423/K10693/MYCBP2, PAM; E3 ubiquitin-protein ligase MYCBP2